MLKPSDNCTVYLLLEIITRQNSKELLFSYFEETGLLYAALSMHIYYEYVYLFEA